MSDPSARLAPRITSPVPGALDAERRALYDAIAGGPRASGPQLFALTDPEGRLTGPFGAMLLAPALGTAVQELGAALRYRTSVPALLRELAICTIAAAERCRFERHAHEPAAVSVGAHADQLAAVRAGAVPDGVDEVTAGGLELVRLLLAGDVTDTDWQRLVPLIGTEMVFELTGLVGYYRMLALQLRVFRTDIDDGVDE